MRKLAKWIVTRPDWVPNKYYWWLLQVAKLLAAAPSALHAVFITAWMVNELITRPIPSAASLTTSLTLWMLICASALLSFCAVHFFVWCIVHVSDWVAGAIGIIKR